MTPNRARLVALFALSAIATTAAASAIYVAEDQQDRSLQSGTYTMSQNLGRGKEAWQRAFQVQLRNEQGKIIMVELQDPLGFSATGKLADGEFTGELQGRRGNGVLQGKLSANNELAGTLKGKPEGTFKLVRVGDIGAEFVQVLRGMEAPGVAVCYSSDGKHLATGTDRGMIAIWDTATGTRKHNMRLGNDRVLGLCFSPDGQQLAASCGYGEKSQLSVWDVATGKQVFPFKRLPSLTTMRSVAYSPDGKWLATASDDRTIELWDAKEGKTARTLKGHSSPVWSVAFSPDGKRLASGSEDKNVKVWDPATGQAVQTFGGHQREVACVAFSPDGKLLASSTRNSYRSRVAEVKVWDVATGKEVRSLKGFVDDVPCVCFHPDGKRLATVSAGAVKLWEAVTGKELGVVCQGRAALWACFSPDGENLAYAGGVVVVWTKLDRLTGMRKGTTSAGKKEGLEVDGKTVGEWVEILQSSTIQGERRVALDALIKAGPKGEAALPVLVAALRDQDSDLAQRAARALASVGASAVPPLTEVLKSDKEATVRGRAAGALGGIGEAAKDAVPALIEVFKNDKDMEVRYSAARALGHIGGAAKDAVPALAEGLKSQDYTMVVECVQALVAMGKEAKPAVPALVAAFRNKDLDEFIWEKCASALGNVGPEAKEAVPALLDALKAKSKGLRDMAGRTLARVDPEAAKKSGFTGPFFMEKVFLRGHKKHAYAVGFGPDGTSLISVSEDNTVKVWDLKTGKERMSFSIPEENYPYNLAGFSPDGKSVAIGGQKHPIVWDTETGKERYKLQDYGRSAIAFSPDGKAIAYATVIKGVYLCDAQTGKKRASFKGGFGRALNSPTFSPDGKTLASADDKAVQLWNVSTGKLKAILKQPQTAWLAFAPDGKTLLTTGADDRMLRSWDVESAKELRSIKIGDALIFALFPDGKMMLGPGHVRPTDVATGKSLPVTIRSGSDKSGFVGMPAFSRDGRFMAAGYLDGGIQVWEVSQ